MEFEQILKSMSEMEKKYYYSLNEDDKTQYILKKMEEDWNVFNRIKGGVRRTKDNLIAGTIFDKDAEQYANYAKRDALTPNGKKIRELQNKLEKLNKEIEWTTSVSEEERLKNQRTQLENQIHDLEASLEDEKAELDKKSEEDKKNRIFDGKVNVVLTNGFNADISKAILANKDNPKNLAFILNSMDKDGEVYKVDTFDKARLKLLDPKSTFTKDEANNIIKYYTSKGFEFPYSADQLASANDLSMYTSKTEAFKNVVSEITKDLKKVERLAGDSLRKNQDVASIFEGIDLDDIDGEILYEGIFDAVTKPLSAAGNLVGNVASAPFNIANSVFNKGVDIGGKILSGGVDLIGKGIKNGVKLAGKGLFNGVKLAGKGIAKGAQATKKAIDTHKQNVNDMLGPIPAFKETLKNAKNLNDINAAMPKFKEDLEMYLKQLGANADMSELKNLKIYSPKNNKSLDFGEFIDIVNGSSNLQEISFDNIFEIAKKQSESSGSENLSDEGASQQTNTVQKDNSQTQSNDSGTQTHGEPQSQQPNANQNKNLDDGEAKKGNGLHPPHKN